MNKQINILLIAPCCYPIWGPESNVNAKFVKTLTDGGYVVDLISADFSNKTYPASNSEFFFKGVREMVITKAKPLSNFKRILYSLRASIYIRNIVILSYKEVEMIKAIDQLCKNHKYDYVISKDGGSNAGFYCAKRYKTRLLYTFNDPWPWNRYPMPYGYGPTCPIPWINKQALKIIAEVSYKILFPSARIRDYVLQYLPSKAQDKGFVLPHTVTSALITKEHNKSKNSELHVLHTGSTGRWRDPQVLFEGIVLFIEKHENAQFKIQFLGVEQKPLPGRTIRDYILKYHLEKYIEIIPPVSYEESLNYISSSNVCLILEANCEEGIFMPTKITDYQQCGKPIWAISPAVGVLNDLYNSNDIEFFSEVTSAISVRNTFEKIYTEYNSFGGELNSSGSTVFYDSNVINEIHRCLKK